MVLRRLPAIIQNQQEYLREKPIEIANEVLKESGDEGIAIATGLKLARQHFEEYREEQPENEG